MKVLQITDDLHVNLESATMIWFDDGAIRFYIPQSDIALIALDDRVYPLPGIRIETAMMTKFDMVVWVQPQHTAFERIHDWISATKL